MDERTKEPIAGGASITINCKPCLRLHLEKAAGAGASPDDVATAFEIGREVRDGAAVNMDAVSANVTPKVPIAADVVLGANGYEFLGP